MSAKVAYFCGQGEHVGAVEGRIQGRHLIKDAACCPHVRLFPIGLALQHLRAKVKPGYQRTMKREKSAWEKVKFQAIIGDGRKRKETLDYYFN